MADENDAGSRDGRGSGLLDLARARHGELGVGAYSGVLCVLSLACCGVLAVVTEEPLLFPSLGPTVMLFFESPRRAAAAPANALVGHAVGIGVGVACLYGFGLADEPASLEHMTAARVVAAALSVGLTAFILRTAHLAHPPAGATTLIVSLGLLHTGAELLTMFTAVVFITALAVGANRVLGTPVTFRVEGEPEGT